MSPKLLTLNSAASCCGRVGPPAALWAQARNRGRTTAPPEALDGDTLIAAQAVLFNPAAFGLTATVVATANVGHLSALTSAALWSDFTP